MPISSLSTRGLRISLRLRRPGQPTRGSSPLRPWSCEPGLPFRFTREIGRRRPSWADECREWTYVGYLLAGSHAAATRERGSRRRVQASHRQVSPQSAARFAAGRGRGSWTLSTLSAVPFRHRSRRLRQRPTRTPRMRSWLGPRAGPTVRAPLLLSAECETPAASGLSKQRLDETAGPPPPRRHRTSARRPCPQGH